MLLNSKLLFDIIDICCKFMVILHVSNVVVIKLSMCSRYVFRTFKFRIKSNDFFLVGDWGVWYLLVHIFLSFQMKYNTALCSIHAFNICKCNFICDVIFLLQWHYFPVNRLSFTIKLGGLVKFLATLKQEHNQLGIKNYTSYDNTKLDFLSLSYLLILFYLLHCITSQFYTLCWPDSVMYFL